MIQYTRKKYHAHCKADRRYSTNQKKIIHRIHLFVTGKDPVMMGKHAQMTGFSRLVTGKFHVQSLWVFLKISSSHGPTNPEGLDLKITRYLTKKKPVICGYVIPI